MHTRIYVHISRKNNVPSYIIYMYIDPNSCFTADGCMHLCSYMHTCVYMYIHIIHMYVCINNSCLLAPVQLVHERLTIKRVHTNCYAALTSLALRFVNFFSKSAYLYSCICTYVNYYMFISFWVSVFLSLEK